MRGAWPGLAFALAATALCACGPRAGVAPPADDAPPPALADLEAFLEAPVLTRADARVRIDPPHRSITGEATLTVRGVTTAEFPIL
ncbi:MAG TPA: hypothetical protein VMV18_13395, partial [bacterium]|nr:hypothetical protein [bacterium]